MSVYYTQNMSVFFFLYTMKNVMFDQNKKQI